LKGWTKRCKFVEKVEEAYVVMKEKAEMGWMEIKDIDMVETQGEMEIDINVLEEPIHGVVVGKGLVGVLSLL
jgi:hypothetical protein